MKKLLLALIPFFLVVISTPTFAQYGAAAVPARQMLIDKKLLNPQNNQFVDNLNIEQHTFLPDQEIIFRVTVTDVVQSELKDLTVNDKLPDVLNFQSSSFGKYDANTKTITLIIDSLKVGESKTFEIKTKVKPAAEIASNVVCQTNLVRVTAGNMVDEDTANFCVSKQVLGVTTQIPVTGPGQTLLILILSTLFLAIGLLIKRIIFLEGR